MKNNKENRFKKEKMQKVHRSYDKGQIFVKVMAGILALMMVVAACATLIFALLAT